MEAVSWQIWIDTGGTFTDCLAYHPDGTLYEQKVLSSGAIRGKIIEQLDDCSFRIQHNWQTDADIFEGYCCYIRVGKPNAQRLKVVSTFLKEDVLVLNQAIRLDSNEEIGFELTAGEEAPILATRMVTSTPLTEALPPIDLRLGSTIGTNALLERKGSKVVLLVTQGFRDVLAIGTQQRPELFSLYIENRKMLYASVIEVKERLDKEGEVVIALTDDEIDRVIGELEHLQPEAIAIGFMHSYRNPIHEERIYKALINRGFDYVSYSSALAPNIKLLPRLETVVTNAYLAPKMQNYLNRIAYALGEGRLWVMTSGGGLVGKDSFHPKDSLLSGPVAGVVGAAYIGQLFGKYGERLLTFDMGGTSTDVARYDGGYEYQYETKVGDAELLSLSLAIETVAAGGGSICSFDGHKFSVGPESAGASPGPACYGAGGALTITDVNVLLGRIDTQRFSVPLSVSAAQEAFELLIKPLGNPSNPNAILEGLLNIANERMAETIRTISFQRGQNPTEYTLLAFGGAGGQHACQVAQLLGVKRIIVPFRAGLLSAYGMGKACVERIRTKQILQPLDRCVKTLPMYIDHLAQEAKGALRQEGFKDEEIYIKRQWLLLRIKGQSFYIELTIEEEESFWTEEWISQCFEAKYRQMIGYYIEGQIIEVVEIKVLSSTLENDSSPTTIDIQSYSPDPQKHRGSYVEGKCKRIGIYDWEALKIGATIQGPAIVANAYSSIWIEPAWSFELQQGGNALLSYTDIGSHASQVFDDAIDLALFTNRFKALANDMGAKLAWTAFSVNVKERLDFSCALLDAKGELIVNAPHIPVHLGSLGVCVRKVIAFLPITPGDVIMTNHPAYGGSHLPDITLIEGVFTERGTLVGYVANRAHHAELGGTRPGSMPPNAEFLSEEGVIIHPCYLVKRGVFQENTVRQLLLEAPYPTRAYEENVADLRAAYASLLVGKKALLQLCRQYGEERIRFFMQSLKEYTAQRIRECLLQLPQNSFSAIERLDDGAKIQVCMKVQRGHIHIDFQGTSDVHAGNLNANDAIVTSAILYVLRLLIKEDLPLNEGIMKAVTLHIPKGMLNPMCDPFDPKYPAVVGGNTETSQRIVDTLLKALGVAACSQGTMNNLLFGGDNWGYYETICGGVGAVEGGNGAHAVHQHMTNTRITDPEIMEVRYPVRLEAFYRRIGSGGKGKWKGGDGVVRKIQFLAPASLSIVSQHRRETPYGMEGGESGLEGKQYILRKSGKIENLAGIDAEEMKIGDYIVILTPGGGAWGKA